MRARQILIEECRDAPIGLNLALSVPELTSSYSFHPRENGSYMRIYSH